MIGLYDKSYVSEVVEDCDNFFTYIPEIEAGVSGKLKSIIKGK